MGRTDENISASPRVDVLLQTVGKTVSATQKLGAALGKSVKLGNQGVAQAGRMAGALGKTRAGASGPDEAAAPRKRKPDPETGTSRTRPDGSDGEVVEQLGVLWRQGERTAATLGAAYRAGARELGQAKDAARSARPSWRTAGRKKAAAPRRRKAGRKKASSTAAAPRRTQAGRRKESRSATERTRPDGCAGDVIAQLGLLWRQGQQTAATLGKAYRTGVRGLEQAEDAAGFFESAWSQASAELSQGRDFFSVLKSVSPLIGEGLTRAKASVTLLGKSVKLGSKGVAQAGQMAVTLGTILAGTSEPDTAAAPRKRKASRKKATRTATGSRKRRAGRKQATGTAAAPRKRRGGRRKVSKRAAGRARPAGGIGDVVAQIGALWRQGQQTAATLGNAYQTGAQGLEQAQTAAGFFKSAWSQASAELSEGRDFFSVLKSVSPLIGEGLASAEKSFTTIGKAVQLGSQGFDQAGDLVARVGGLLGGGGSDRAGAAGGKPGGLVRRGIDVAVKGGASLGKLGGSLFGLARSAIPAVITGVRALGVALMSNPVGLIIGGIALAAGLIIHFWEPIKGFFSGLWESVKSIFSTTWEWIKGIFFNYHPLGLVINHWGSIKGFFTGLWESVKSIFSTTWEWIKGIFLDYHPLGLVIKHWDSITGYFGALWESVKAIFAQGLEWLKTSFLERFQVIADTVGAVWRLITGDPAEESDAGAANGKQTAAAGSRSGAATHPGGVKLGSALTDAPATTSATLASARLPAPAQSGHTMVNQQSHYQIAVQATPGMDERQLALMVRQQLEEHERRARVDQRRALHD